MDTNYNVDHRRRRSRGLGKARCVRRHMAHGMSKTKARRKCHVKAR